MQQPVSYSAKWFQPIAIGVSLLSVILYAATSSYLVLVVPFGFLFMALMAMNWKLAWWIMLFTIPASIQIWFLNDSLSTSVPDEPMMWLFLIMFGLLFFRDPRILPQWWWRDPLVLITALQFLWTLIAVIFSEEPLISWKFFLAKIWFLVSFFIMPIFIFKEKKDYKNAFLLVLYPLLVTMLIIFYRHKQSNFNFRTIEKAIWELYYNHVDYSTVISMFFPMLVVAYPLTRNKKWWVRVLLILIILFFLPAIYLTYARAAMLAVVFSVTIALAIKLRLVNLIMPAFYGVVIAAVFFMVRDNTYIQFRPDYEHTVMHKSFAQHMAATIRGKDMSSMERLYRWVASVRMSNERPWTGVGPNAFYDYYKSYAVSSFRTYVSRNEERSTTHNYFLLMLVEQGWPAMILYGILVLVYFAQAQKVYWRFTDRFYRSVTLGAAMMFAAAFINNFFSELIETHKVGALFYISIALIIILDRKSKELAAETEVKP